MVFMIKRYSSVVTKGMVFKKKTQKKFIALSVALTRSKWDRLLFKLQPKWKKKMQKI